MIEDGLRDIEQRRGYEPTSRAARDGRRRGRAPEYLQGALVAMDPHTGAVRAMVGGRDFARAASTAPPRPSAVRLGVQAVRLCRGARRGYSPAIVIDQPQRAGLTPQGDWVPEDEHSNAAR